jgi:flagellar hook assembly protein FlgD
MMRAWMRCFASVMAVWIFASMQVISEARATSRGSQTAVSTFKVTTGRSYVRVAFALLNPVTEMRVTVHDLTGRSVRTVRDGVLAQGDHGEIYWDGRTTTGQRVPSGFYWIRIEIDEKVSVLKVWFLR